MRVSAGQTSRTISGDQLGDAERSRASTSATSCTAGRFETQSRVLPERLVRFAGIVRQDDVQGGSGLRMELMGLLKFVGEADGGANGLAVREPALAYLHGPTT